WPQGRGHPLPEARPHGRAARHGPRRGVARARDASSAGVAVPAAPPSLQSPARTRPAASGGRLRLEPRARDRRRYGDRRARLRLTGAPRTGTDPARFEEDLVGSVVKWRRKKMRKHKKRKLLKRERHKRK